MCIFVEYTLKPMIIRCICPAVLLVNVFLLYGCRKNDKVVTVEEDIPIYVSVATQDTYKKFNDGDTFGLFVVNETQTLATAGNQYDNELLTFDDGEFVSNDLYYKDGRTKTYFYCYYPYVETITDIATLPFSVNADQSTSDGYCGSVFIWGRRTIFKPSEWPVKISMKHLTPILRIELKPGKGWTAEELAEAEVTICGLRLGGLINLENGSVDAVGDVSEIKANNCGDAFSAFVIPQSVNDVELVKIRLGTDEYSAVTSIELLSGQRYTCQVTISKTNGNFNATIGGWETDFNDYGGMVD